MTYDLHTFISTWPAYLLSTLRFQRKRILLHPTIHGTLSRQFKMLLPPSGTPIQPNSIALHGVRIHPLKSIHSLSTFLYNTRIAHIAESVHACTHVPKSFRTCSSEWSVVHVPKSLRTSSLKWNVVLVPESVRASLEHANFPPKFLGSA